MAWNKPSTENQQPVKKRAAKAPSAKRGIIAGALVVVAIGALCFWMFSGGETRQDAASTKERGRIKEVAPVTPKAKPVTTSEPAAPKPIRWAKYVQNAALDDEGRPQFVPRPGHRYVTNAMSRAKLEHEIFKYSYQNELADYLSAMPGTTYVGEMRYDDDFVKEVVETMSLPIEDDKNDTEDQRALREHMRQVMKELREAVDKGEDVKEIFKLTREEMQNLGIYKMQLKQELDKIYSNPDMTDADLDDALKAANMMLENKGIAPLEMSEFSREILKNAKDMSGEVANGSLTADESETSTTEEK